MRICLQIGKSDLMSRSKIDSYPDLRDAFQSIVKSQMQGLMFLVQPDNTFLCQLTYKQQKLIYEFI